MRNRDHQGAPLVVVSFRSSELAVDTFGAHCQPQTKGFQHGLLGAPEEGHEKVLFAWGSFDYLGSFGIREVVAHESFRARTDGLEVDAHGDPRMGAQGRRGSTARVAERHLQVGTHPAEPDLGGAVACGSDLEVIEWNSHSVIAAQVLREKSFERISPDQPVLSTLGYLQPGEQLFFGWPEQSGSWLSVTQRGMVGE